MANLPSYIGKGTFTSGTGALSVPPPTGITNEDLLLLFVESANQAVTTPAGWTQAPSSPQSTGTAAAAGGVRLTVFWKGVGGVEGNVSVADTGDHTTAIMMAFRGVNLQDPFNTSAGGVKAAASTAVSAPGVTTTVANTLIVHGIGLDKDLADADTITTAWVNANLANITERHDQSVASGVGGGVAVVTGEKLTAGATGNTTATSDTSTTLAYITLALQAPEPVVRTVAQYKSDGVTPIAVGGNTLDGDGATNNLFLRTEYDSGIRELATTPKIEVEPVGTAFNGVATATFRPIKQLASDVNSSRRGGSLVYDTVNKRLLYFGGYDGTTRYNDVWERYIDRVGQPWRKLSPTGTPPTGRNLHGATVVTGNLTSGGAVRSYMIIWGGADPSDKNDMLALRIDTPGSEAWTTITQTSAPSVRSYVNGHLVSTPVSGANDQNHIYLFGGWAAARENALYRCTFDVDTPTAVTWTTLKANGAGGNPPIRSGAVMDYKASTGKLYLYGGYSGSAMLNDFWEYDIAGNTWTDTSPSGTAPTGSEALAGGYDAVNNRFWFTGGWTTNGTFSTGLNQVGYINDVGGSESYVVVRANTAIDNDQTYAGNSFSAFTTIPDLGYLYMRGMATVDSNERYDYIIDFAETATSDFPVYGSSIGEYYTARDAMASVWNPDANEWVNIGGFDDMSDDATIATGTHSGDIWTYNYTTNSWRYANKGFKTLPPLEGMIAAYDTLRDRIIVFGGLTGVTEVSNGVWQLVRDSYGNYEATALFPTGTKPQPRWLGACVYDAANDRFIIALGGDGSTAQNNVWALNFSGSADGAWTQLTPTGSVTGVIGVGFADKPSNSRLYIFGGATNAGLTTVSSQFVYLDYSTTNCAWNTVTQSGATARRTPAMAYDSTNNRIIVMGGFNGTNVINTTSWYNLGSGTAWANAATTVIPDARRSHIGEFFNGKFYITGGRPNSGTWYRNTWELTPNYTTPNSSTWVNKYPASFTPISHVVTGLATSTSYHWQAWTTEGSVDSAKVSFGGNAETDADFIVSNASVQTRTHTTSANKRKQSTVTHTTNSYLQKPQYTVDHTTDALKTLGTTTQTLTFYTASSADDAREVISTGAMDLTATSYNTSGLDHIGWRFPNVTLPQGTTIVSAKFGVGTLNNYQGTGGVSGTLRLEASDNAAQFTSTSGNISARSVGSAAQTNPAATIAWETGWTVTSAVQAVLNRAGWSSGNAMAVLFKGSGVAGSFIEPLMWDYFSGYDPAWLEIVITSVNPREMRRQHTTDAFKLTSGQSIATSTYYFDGHSGISDPDSAWSGDANAFDGSTATIASNTADVGSASVRFLHGQGTNAPSTGTEITQVRVRVYGNLPEGGGGSVNIYTDGLESLLGSVNVTSASGNATWSSYATLTAPGGGWTWAVLQELELKAFKTLSNFSDVQVNRVEIEVSYLGASAAQITKTHTTSSVKRKQFTVSHTTSSNKKKTTTLSHTTSANKKKATTVSHTTNSLLRKQFTKTHTTDALKRKAFTLSHTTSANKKKATTVSHTTSANKRVAAITRTHTTDAYKRVAFVRSHTTDANKKKATTLSHTTSANKRVAGITLAHTTNSFLRKQFALSHTTSANRRKATTVAHTTSANKKKATTVSHTTSANKRKAITVSHTTSANKRVAGNVRSHTTDSLLRRRLTVFHTTDANRKKVTTVSHTTSANKRKAITVAHTTSANKRAVNTRSHTTDSFKRGRYTVSHTTDARPYKPQFSDIIDNFDDNTLNTAFWEVGTWTQAETGGKAQFFLDGSGELRVRTHPMRTLIGNSLFFQHQFYLDAFFVGVIEFVDASDVMLFQLQHVYDTNTVYVMNSSYSTLDSWTPSSATEWIRIRESGGTIYVETSSTPTSWTLQYSGTTPAGLNNARLQIRNGNAGGSYSKGGPSGWVDNFNVGSAQYTINHTTDALLRKQAALTHTTSSALRKQNTLSHTTNANKKKANNTVSHTTNALKRKLFTLSHTTNALLRRQLTLAHTTNALKRKATALTHTTNSLLRKANTVSHTTSANKRVAAITRSHTTDANKKKANNLLTHTTNALKRSLNTLSHTTDALKKVRITLSHTTSSFLRRQIALLHTTDANLRKVTTRAHTTNANKRKATVVLHTTSANKKKANNVLTHTTDALKRIAFTKTHTTDSFLRKQVALSHTTNALNRKANALVHTTDANSRKATTVFHTTSSNKKKAGNTVFHTTSANKKKANNVVTHTTNALKRTLNTLSHTTSSFLRRQLVLTHTTDSFLRSANTRSHTADANKKRAYTVAHTTSANKKKAGNVVSHTTNTLKRAANVLTHTTNALKKIRVTLSHTTNSFLRRRLTLAHTTNALLRRQIALTHTTSANKRKANNLLSHSTDANKRKVNVLSHTTDALKRTINVLSHSTDAFLRRAVELAHTTDANKKKSDSVSHTTSAFKRTGTELLHSTDANKRKLTEVSHTTDALIKERHELSHSTDAFKRSENVLSHTTSANKRKANTVSHTTSANKRRVTTVNHTTSANLRKALTRFHTTNANKRKLTTVSHTTNALKRKLTAVVHTTDALLRQQFTRSHSTDTNKRLATVVAHTTDANKKSYQTIAHTTNAFKRTDNMAVHNTDANKKRGYSVSHTTDTSKYTYRTVDHTTDALLRKEYIVSHTTSANKRKSNVVVHATDALKRKANTLAHTTNALKRKITSVFHTTSANKKRANTIFHTTSANKKRATSVSHTTDAFLRQRYTVSHTTDTLLRKSHVIVHTTDANKKRATTVSHTTNASIFAPAYVSHTTDALLFARRGNKKVLVNGEWVYGVPHVLIGGVWTLAVVEYYDGTNWHLTEQ